MTQDIKQKKKHHYIPIAYLERFTDNKGKVFAYKKDTPNQPLYLKPNAIGFERYYYSQPIEGGRQDNNRLEDFFSELETHWPPIVDSFSQGKSAEGRVEEFFQFVALQRARVPAARDGIELWLAALVQKRFEELKRLKQIPEPPEGFEDILDNVQISIDPHRSIHAIPQLMKEFAELYEIAGLEIVHNKTDIDFITSDNPVCYYGSNRMNDKIVPYPNPPIQKYLNIIFPITPKIAIIGSRKTPVLRSGMHLRHSDMIEKNSVNRNNRTIAQFAYRFVFSKTKTVEDLVKNYSAVCPISFFKEDNFVFNGTLPRIETVFGSRREKAKWRNSQSGTDDS
ncbi:MULTISPECIES: DUF4238 domain-containing protein [unclassified Bosea (in: a-proteobacteria)]|uniref:DUF4238 domain-containing protein n=1 Tax=unclassified Bosea (in: a-proteobacteria) TaxID=2653178 RepID=UPI0013DFBE7D|nr:MULTISPECIES: DUF4238 domain-containing protein [unclassified Bosea (in: a-proteobacteria)]